MSATITRCDREKLFFSTRGIKNKNKKPLQEYPCENIYCVDKMNGLYSVGYDSVGYLTAGYCKNCYEYIGTRLLGPDNGNYFRGLCQNIEDVVHRYKGVQKGLTTKITGSNSGDTLSTGGTGSRYVSDELPNWQAYRTVDRENEGQAFTYIPDESLTTLQNDLHNASISNELEETTRQMYDHYRTVNSQRDGNDIITSFRGGLISSRAVHYVDEANQTITTSNFNV